MLACVRKIVVFLKEWWQVGVLIVVHAFSALLVAVVFGSFLAQDPTSLEENDVVYWIAVGCAVFSVFFKLCSMCWLSPQAAYDPLPSGENKPLTTGDGQVPGNRTFMDPGELEGLIFMTPLLFALYFTIAAMPESKAGFSLVGVQMFNALSVIFVCVIPVVFSIGEYRSLSGWVLGGTVLYLLCFDLENKVAWTTHEYPDPFNSLAFLCAISLHCYCVYIESIWLRQPDENWTSTKRVLPTVKEWVTFFLVAKTLAKFFIHGEIFHDASENKTFPILMEFVCAIIIMISQNVLYRDYSGVQIKSRYMGPDGANMHQSVFSVATPACVCD